MLNIYKTNRIELISEVLAKELLINPPYITEKLNISTQNYFLSKWIRDQITLNNEISALYEIKTLPKYTEEIIRNLTKEKNIKSWNQESIKWSIIDSLEEFSEFKEAWPLMNWIDKFIVNHKSLNQEVYSLSEKIANIFCDYLLFRTELIEKWYFTDIKSSKLFKGLNEDQYWQPILFKLIVKNKLNKPICIYMREIIKKIDIFKNSSEIIIPRNIYIVAINDLTKLQMNFFSKLSEIINVNIYLLSPGYDLWNRLNIEEGAVSHNQFPNKRIFKENIEIIFGKYIANSEKLIDETIVNEELKANIQTPYIDPTITTKPNNKVSLLNQIQRNIVNGEKHKFQIKQYDETFIFRGCRNSLKELEYIKNKIIKILSTNKDINYSDILIATNEINQIKPYVKYIFNYKINIPYFLSIENYKEISPFCNFLQLLIETINKKFTLNEINSLLSDPILQTIFKFNNNEKDEILLMLKDMGFHWGINSSERLGESKNNLEWCIKRLTLGLIYDEDFYIQKQELKPFTTSSSNIDINKWIIILKEIKNIVEVLRKKSNLKNWIINFRNIFNNLNISNEILNDDLSKLNEILEDFSKRVDSEIVIESDLLSKIFNDFFNNQKRNLDKRTNEVLISDIESARLIPHKIIFVMGMNQISFPRKVRKDNINLLNNEYKFGDPSLVDKEKYFFLELLISCREQFIISWSYYDLENNILEISTPIRQLINTFKNQFDSNNLETLVSDINHNNDKSNELFSSKNKNVEGLIKYLLFEYKTYPCRKYKLTQLINWFKSPQLHWLKQKNIFPKKSFNYEPSDEKISNYQKYRLLNKLLEDISIDNNNFKETLNQVNIKQQIISNGIISPKNSIDLNELEIHTLVQSLISNFDNLNNIQRQYLKKDFNKIEFFKCEDQIIELIHSNINFTKRSETWLRLLFISSYVKDINKAHIIYRKNNIYKKETLNVSSSINANKLINEYVSIYQNTIETCLPLPPESSYKYVKAFLKNNDYQKAFIDEWIGNKDFNLGERDKPEMQICYGYKKEPQFFLKNKHFKELSLKLYKPFIESFETR